MSFRTIPLLMLCTALLIGLFSCATGYNESHHTGVGTIAFYNVENLFDTVDDPHTKDEDFTPTSSLQWDGAKYQEKQEHLAQVIANFDKEGLAIMGLAEIEHKQVVEELLQTAALAGKGYRCIAEESNDPRGIDVALIYSQAFTVLSHHVLRPCKDQDCLESRDVLAVQGILMKDTVWVYVNHWPSRRAGTEESNAKRLILSAVLKHSVDSVLTNSPASKIIIMGDFNDTPADASIANLMKGESLFNPFTSLSTEEVGSIKFKKDWLIFDQIILSNNWQQDKKSSSVSYKSNTAAVYHPAFLHYKELLRNGPFRSYNGEKYGGGYSDHFPVYLHYND
jgi:exonuclease III